jgi:transcriptional regulator with XRE-family HTH domain
MSTHFLNIFEKNLSRQNARVIKCKSGGAGRVGRAGARKLNHAGPATSIMTAAGTKLREAREHLRQSLDVVAAATGRPKNTIRNAETGHVRSPAFDLVADLARYYRLPLDWLADDSAQWPPPAGAERQVGDLLRQVLTEGGLAGELSAQERELLAMMRALPADLRQRWLDRSLAYAEGLLAAEAAASPGSGLRAPGSAAAATPAVGSPAAGGDLTEAQVQEMERILAEHYDRAVRPRPAVARRREKAG